MSTLRRILKYTPAVLFALLVALWLAYSKYQLSAVFGRCSVYAVWTRMTVRRDESANPSTLYFHYIRRPPQQVQFEHPLGELFFSELFTEGWVLNLPILLLVTAALPIGLFPWLRFRLWHYFAYTALVAFELAYYLRWQE